MRKSLLFALLFLNAACVSYPPDSPPPGYSQSSPKQTIYYLQWAYENENPLHVAKCLSVKFMEGENMDPSDLAIAWGDAKEFVEKQIGNVDDVEVVDELSRSDDGRIRVLLLESDKRKAKITFVLESRYRIIPNKAIQDDAENEFPSMEEIMTYDGNTAVIRLPNVPSPDRYAPSAVHRIIIESAWRIDKIHAEGLNPVGNKSSL